jgi:transposase
MDRSRQVIIIGVDAHKSTHTFVAVDEVGRQVGQLTAAATPDGHLSALEWYTQWPRVQFALEDCRHVTRRLEADLLRRGHAVVRVKTQLMAVHRRSARQPGKSDPIDAQAVAMAALREPNLPIARLDGPVREVKLLSDHRHNLVCERTKLINRLRWHLHELDPELHIPARGLRRYRVMDELADRITEFTGVVAQIAGELLQRCRQMTHRIDDLEREIRGRVRVLAPSLLAVPGCGVLSAAVIIGETAGAHRFHSKDAYAKFNARRPDPGLVGARTGSSGSRREPRCQRRPACHRHHPSRPRWSGQGLCGQAAGRWKDPAGGTAPAPPPRLRPCVPGTACRRICTREGRERNVFGGGLT